MDSIPFQGEFFATDCWGAVYRQGEETLPTHIILLHGVLFIM